MSQVIDKKLHAAIDKLNDSQKKEVLIFVEQIAEKEYDKWEDEGFVAEMEKRRRYYENGGKMVSGDEGEKRIEKLFNKALK